MGVVNVDVCILSHLKEELAWAVNKQLQVISTTVGRINFEDKKFRGFHGYLLNLKIKYPCNFLYTRSRYFVQHVHVVGKWLALWKYFKRATEVKISVPSPTGSLYQATFSCRAATKEIQRMIDTINDGTLYLRRPVRISTYTV